MAERKFRDGKREIPDYMHDMMQGLQTHKMTYQEALVAMNAKALKDHLNTTLDRLVMTHFAETRRS
jgi:hypothetical protein